jgi:hypothetical protein
MDQEVCMVGRHVNIDGEVGPMSDIRVDNLSWDAVEYILWIKFKDSG